MVSSTASCLPPWSSLSRDRQVVQLEVGTLWRNAWWQVGMDVLGKEGGRLLLRFPHFEYSPSLGRHARAVSDETLRLLEQCRESAHSGIVALLHLARDKRSNENSHVSASLPYTTRELVVGSHRLRRARQLHPFVGPHHGTSPRCDGFETQRHRFQNQRSRCQSGA